MADQYDESITEQARRAAKLIKAGESDRVPSEFGETRVDRNGNIIPRAKATPTPLPGDK